MKNIITLLLLLSVCFTYSQGAAGSSYSWGKVNLSVDNNVRNMGYFFRNNNNGERILGTNYLFDSWENECVIHTMDNNQFKLSNINLNLERHTFDSQIGNDSIFTFNFNNIEKLVINGRVFKNYFWNDDNQVYEIVFESDSFQLLKGYRVLYVPPSIDPKVNRKSGKYVRTPNFYGRQNEEISSFRLNKKSILALFETEVDKRKVADYVKQQQLSFKNENDLRKILNYAVLNLNFKSGS